MGLMTRRSALVWTARSTAMAPLAMGILRNGTAMAEGLPQPGAANPPGTSDSHVHLPPFKSRSEQQSGGLELPLPPDQRVGFALVGLGNLALSELLPAFANSKLAKLTALVSGDSEKAHAIASRYGVPAKGVYSYATFDQIKDNPDVQVVYIVLPNSMHKEYTLRAAAAGKHVLTEKPMATSTRDAEAMTQACNRAGRKLMVAYRMQYEPYNGLMRQMVREQTFGKPKFIEAINGQVAGAADQWRHQKAMAGGGSLPDVGLYCLNACRFLTGQEPEEVFAWMHSTPNDPRFREVEEHVSWQMRFPSGLLANCATSYGIHEARRLRVYADKGWFGLEPAFAYRGLRMELSRADNHLERQEQPSLAEVNQFAREIDHMADCVRRDRKPHTPGEEGVQDHRVMEAIYASAAAGKPVRLEGSTQLDSTRGPEPFSS